MYNHCPTFGEPPKKLVQRFATDEREWRNITRTRKIYWISPKAYSGMMNVGPLLSLSSPPSDSKIDQPLSMKSQIKSFSSCLQQNPRTLIKLECRILTIYPSHDSRIPSFSKSHTLRFSLQQKSFHPQPQLYTLWSLASSSSRVSKSSSISATTTRIISFSSLSL